MLNILEEETASFLILIHFSNLRRFVPRHLHKDHLEITRCDALPAMLDIDEESIYTYAKYLEPLNTMTVNIDELLSDLECSHSCPVNQPPH